MSKILYIEDNRLSSRLVKKLLARVGLEVLQADTGEMGLTIAKEEKPNLILVDINLPDMDGLEVTRRLKANPQLVDIPVIAISADSMHDEAARGLEAGCVAYLQKPVGRQELYNTMRDYIPEAFESVVWFSDNKSS
jgi:CheY-like chemotaxis protein